MDGYNLKQDIICREIFEKIQRGISGFGYEVKPSPRYDGIDFGEGVKLFMKLHGEKVDFSWGKPDVNTSSQSKESRYGRNPTARIFLGNAAVWVFLFVIGIIIDELHIPWNSVRDFLVNYWPFDILVAVMLYVLLFLIPLSAVSRTIHQANIQQHVHDIILAYRYEEK